MRRDPQYHLYELTSVVLKDWDPVPHIHIIFLKVFSYFNHFEIYLSQESYLHVPENFEKSNIFYHVKCGNVRLTQQEYKIQSWV